VVRIEPGEQDTATVVMAGDTVTGPDERFSMLGEAQPHSRISGKTSAMATDLFWSRELLRGPPPRGERSAEPM
jgi:hypothetical protein